MRQGGAQNEKDKYMLDYAQVGPKWIRSSPVNIIYFQVGQTEFRGKAIVLGALTLYLDFINLFLFLLRLMGERR